MFVFDEASNLSVEHSIELGNEDDIISEFSMLGEEGQPVFSSLHVPFSRIEKELRFIDDNHDFLFREFRVGKVG